MLLQIGAPLRELRIGDQDVRRPLVEIDPHAIAGRKSPGLRRSGFGEALRIDGDAEVPDCRPSPMQGNDARPF